MNICVWGEELSAWVARAQLASYGNTVYVTDGHLEPVTSQLRSEPGLLAALQNAELHQRLILDPDAAIQAQVHWFAMAPDEAEQALTKIKQIAAGCHGPLLIVNQSNFGVGMCDQMQALLASPQQQVVYMPDLLQAGQAMQQFANPEALLIGTADRTAFDQLIALLRPFHLGQRTLQQMSCREAEFVKYAITGLLALRLGYINELAGLCDQLNLDMDAIRRGMSSDKRIGNHYLQPSCGFGGLQFTQYLQGLAELLTGRQGSVLIDTVLAQNEVNKEWPFRTLWQHFNCNLRGRKVAIWGVAFKSGVADIDNAPALRVIDALLAQGVQICAHDPEAMQALAERYSGVSGVDLSSNAYDAAVSADALLLLTDWPEYSSPDFVRLKERMQHPLIIDGRNLYDPYRVQQAGFVYYTRGRNSLSKHALTNDK